MSESETIDDGGPAFPHDEFTKDGNHYKVHPGISMLDWFAGQALAAIFCADEIASHSRAETAECCYSMAEAMLEQRERLNAKPS